LDFAARVIHGVTLPEAVMKTRIRRLYDIANILQSLQLIQKVQVTESNGVKKPAFQYIGPDVDSMGKFFFLNIFLSFLNSELLCFHEKTITEFLSCSSHVNNQF
jgi:hypothetical protein